MAKSFLEECQARLKHQLSDYWWGEGGAALTAIIVHKNSGIYLHKELIESPGLCHSHFFILVEEASEKPACAISANAGLKSLCLVGNQQARLPTWVEAPEQAWG